MKEYTSLEISKQLQAIGVCPLCEEYYWQEISSINYQDDFDAYGLAANSPKVVEMYVGQPISQGSDIISRKIERVCRAFTFEQLRSTISEPFTVLNVNVSAADQVASYIISKYSENSEL